MRSTFKAAVLAAALTTAGAAQALVITNTVDPADVLISTIGQTYSYIHNFGQPFAPGPITAITLDVFFTDTGGSESFTASYDPTSISSFSFKNVATLSQFSDSWISDEFDALLLDGTVEVTIRLDDTNASSPGAKFTRSILSVNYDSADSAQSGALETAVPEPATATLFGAGLLGLAWARRRKR